MSFVQFSANSRWSRSHSSDTIAWAEDKIHEGHQKFPPAFAEKTFDKTLLEQAEKWARNLHAQEVHDLIVIGMGGSSLGAKALESVIQHAFIGKEKYQLHFWEGTHPTAIAEILHKLEQRRVAGLFVSKSGTTLESRSMLALFRQFFPESPVTFVTSYPDKVQDLNPDPAGVFLIPGNLGGRYSVISPVGILPAAFLKGNIHALVGSFYQTLEKLDVEIPFVENPAKQTALAYYRLFTSGFHTNVLWSYAREYRPMVDWLVQLWAESLGKNETIRALPVAAHGPEDQHSLLQYYMAGANEYVHTFFHVGTYGSYSIPIPSDFPVLSAGKSLWRILQSQMKSIEMALDKEGRPILEILSQEPEIKTTGAMMAFWMRVVAFMGGLYGINPYDQPGVEAGKVYCKEILEQDQFPENLNPIFEL